MLPRQQRKPRGHAASRHLSSPSTDGVRTFSPQSTVIGVDEGELHTEVRRVRFWKLIAAAIGLVCIIGAAAFFSYSAVYNSQHGYIRNSSGYCNQLEQQQHPQQEPLQTQSRKYQQHGLHSYIEFGCYRTGPQNFTAIGLSPLVLHDDKDATVCWWQANDGSKVDGQLRYYFVGEHHDLTYEVLYLDCTLSTATAVSGGNLFMRIDKEDVMVLEEEPGQPLLPGPDTIKYDVAFCGAPMYGQLAPHRVEEWLQYHLAAGIQHYIFYDVGACQAPDMAQALAPHITSGLIEVIDMEEMTQYDVWVYAQVLAVNDCAYRTRFIAKYTAFWDFDEYIWLEPPLPSVLSLAEAHQNPPWITLGSIWWSIELCLEEGQDALWDAERMVWRWPGAYCAWKEHFPLELCLSYWGHRKYIADPRRIRALEIHRAVWPANEGLDLETDVAWLNHYKGITGHSANVCTQPHSEDFSHEWWHKDMAMHDYVRAVRLKQKETQLPAAGSPA